MLKPFNCVDGKCSVKCFMVILPVVLYALSNSLTVGNCPPKLGHHPKLWSQYKNYTKVLISLTMSPSFLCSQLVRVMADKHDKHDSVLIDQKLNTGQSNGRQWCIMQYARGHKL